MQHQNLQIIKKKLSLIKAFEEQDEEKTGDISLETWSNVLNRVTRLQVNWKILLPLLMAQYEDGNKATVNYHDFLDSFQLQFVGMGYLIPLLLLCFAVPLFLLRALSLS